MTDKVRIYIGSSSEGLPYARAVRDQLRADAEVLIWDEGVFRLGDATLEALDKAMERFKFEYAVLVLTADDQREMRDRRHPIPRDNVLMEVGLFMGRLGRSRTFVVHQPSAELPSNLYGICIADLDDRKLDDPAAAVSSACVKIRQAIERHQAEPWASGQGPFGQELHGFRNVGEAGFLEKTIRLVETCKEITFVGTGLNVLTYNNMAERIIRRVAAGELTATLCFGNPFAPGVRQRLIEEERCVPRPEVAAEGIIRRVNSLLPAARAHPKLAVKLFNNYPTMSIFRFDNRQFVYYPMGYRKLGNLCPVQFVEKPGALPDFLDDMIGNYVADAVDAREVFRIKVERDRTKHFIDRERIRAVAVYAIPDKDSDFYKQGARLLGYDVFGGELPAPAPGAPADEEVRRFREHVGGARQYGLHVSASDVMYLEVNQVPELLSELGAIAAGANRFDFAVRSVAVDQFGENSIALECEDPSGQFERLLAEITVRIRPMALGTNYTLDPNAVRLWREEGARDRLMVESYQSPYVLGGFRPHFTLASPEDAPDDLEALAEAVRRRFSRYLSGIAKVPINRLYVLQKPVDAPYWDAIRDEHIIHLR